VKHIHQITVTRPATADIVQDVICQVSLAFAALLGEKGGESPILNFLNNKCDLPGTE
jgi:hypothetical protein